MASDLLGGGRKQAWQDHCGSTAFWASVFLLLASPLVPQSEGISAQIRSDYTASRHGGMYMHNYYIPPAPSTSPWYPTWHPSGHKVAVSMAGSIWEVNPKTGAAVEVVAGSGYVSSPNYSPDGRWLVYTRDDAGVRIQLEVLDTQTGRTIQLTDDQHIYTDPRFSPDGTRLAFVSTQPAGYFNVYIQDFHDGDLVGNATAVTKDNSYGRQRLYFGEWDMHLSPAWLPNGEELLIVSNRDVALGSGNVYRIPAKEDGILEATPVLREQSLYRTQPHVSYDGRRFVYSSTSGTADQFNNLYVQPTVGGEPYKLTFFEHDAFHPRWSPDGESIAFISNQGGLPHLAILETYGGKLTHIELTRRTFMRPMGKLSVTTVSGTGVITASRTHLEAADGKFYAPSDAYARLSRVGDPIFHHAGTFEIDLPIGPVSLTTLRGFEVTPETQTVEIREGETTTLKIVLEEISDVSDEGWYSGSTHVHMNYAGNLHNTLANLMMMSDAEDQDVVNEQVANKDNRILDHQFWIPGGGIHPISQADRILQIGQEFRPPFYGHVFMFGIRDHLISPYTTGYEGTAIESLYPSNTDMLRKAKEQGATVGYVHSFFNDDPLETGLGGAKGFIVDAALLATDAIEWSIPQNGWPPLYAVWSNDLRVAAVGGEDSISNLHATPLLGSMRTYVKTANGQLDMDEWLAGLREGHSYVSSGPLMEFSVDGKSAGEELNLDGPNQVSIEARIWSIVPLTKAELVWDGEVIATYEFSGDRKELRIDDEIEVTGSGWFHLRVEGDPEERWPLDARYAQAFTNPVWVTIGDQPIRNASAADYALRWIDKLQEMAEEWPDWRAQREKDHVYGQFDAARAIYRQRGSEDTPNGR